jgi:hypothetical protein
MTVYHVLDRMEHQYLVKLGLFWQFFDLQDILFYYSNRVYCLPGLLDHYNFCVLNSSCSGNKYDFYRKIILEFTEDLIKINIESGPLFISGIVTAEEVVLPDGTKSRPILQSFKGSKVFSDT